MAIELEQKPAPPPAPAKYENYVEQELAKVRGRIRTLDAGGFLLLFFIATLGYALVLALVDRERAVNSRLPLLLGAVLLGLVLALMMLFVMEGGRFGELLSRAFAPFRDIQLGSQTTITMVQPEGGDVTVPLNRTVNFRVRI